MTICERALALAAALLPRDVRDRCRDEWVAEYRYVRETDGLMAARSMTMRIIVRVPVLAARRQVYGDVALALAALAALSVLVPLARPHPYSVAANLIFAGGLLITAGCAWRAERAIFESRNARIGLGIALLGGGTALLVHEFTEGTNLVLEGTYSLRVGSWTAFSGLVVLFLASVSGRRPKMFVAGIVIAMVGTMSWAGIALANAVTADSLSSRLLHTLTVIAMVGASTSCWGALKRGIPDPA